MSLHESPFTYFYIFKWKSTQMKDNESIVVEKNAELAGVE